MPRKPTVPLPWGGHQHAIHVARYWGWVDVRGADECWPWLASRRDKGYGQFYWFGHNEKAHRVAFSLAYGYWPENALHTCDHPWCCNPGHLYEGTIAQNNADMARRGRHWRQARPALVPRGEWHHGAVLTEDDVLTIRERAAAGVSQYVLAEEFGVAQSTIWRVIHRLLWRHVP